MASNHDIRVFSVCTSDTHGGAARAAYRIHQGVRSLGVDSRMFVKNKESQDPNVSALAEFVPNNPIYNVWDWCANKVKNKIQHHYWNQYPNKDVNYKSDLRGTRLHGALQKLNYDVLHLHWINNRFLDIRELSKIHKPIVWTMHDSWPFTGICHVPMDCSRYTHQCGACPQLGSNDMNDLSHQIWKCKEEIYHGLDLHIVTPSKWLADCVKQSTLLRQFPVTVIPNGLDTDVYHVIPEVKNRKESNKPVILYGANHAINDKNKGFQNLLTALRILDNQGFEAQLVVFGADADLLPINFQNIDVRFEGYIVDTHALVSLYNKADVMVVPSYSEVFGQTASEAMACATPVVAFRCTGIQEVVEEGCGYLAEPYSPEDLAVGIRFCIEHNSNNKLGKAARESVEKRYAVHIVAEQYKQLYESLA